MNVLVLGGGGREHALADKLASSPHCKKLFIAPGNAGTSLLGQNVILDHNDHEAIKTFCVQETISLVIVGPEAPLVNGIVDFFSDDDFGSKKQTEVTINTGKVSGMKTSLIFIVRAQ